VTARFQLLVRAKARRTGRDNGTAGKNGKKQRREKDEDRTRTGKGKAVSDETALAT
jgi:hypothetical protein